MITAARRLSQTCWVGVVVLAAAAFARGGEDRLELGDGKSVAGRLEGNARSGLVFRPAAGGVPVALEAGMVARFSSVAPDGGAGQPPFRVAMGQVLRLSGQLRGLDRKQVVFAPVGLARDVELPRPGVQALYQRPGEIRVLVDSFEQLDPGRWLTTGAAALAADPVRSGSHALALPGAGASVAARLPQPIAAGQIEISYFDKREIVAERQALVEATFQGLSGPLVVQVILGFAEETLAVRSPEGPALAVQRLPRVAGWHRLMLRFDAGSTEIAVDGKELAHGKGPSGPLTAIQLATTATAQAKSPAPSVIFDDLSISRFAQPPAGLELDADQDEARLILGDQLFGTIERADLDSILMTIDSGPATLLWSEVAGLYLRREPRQGEPVEGLLARVSWFAGTSTDPAELDFAEGAIKSLDTRALAIATPYAGTLVIPRDRLVSIQVQAQGTRIVLDPAAHHLGDEISSTEPVLDPPQPEGATLSRELLLSAQPTMPAFVVLDLIGVVGEDNDPTFSRFVREGELRTWLAVNGKRIDYVNRFIKTRNETPERIAIPVPEGLLTAGKNTITLELTGMARRAKELDDLGVLQVAVELRPKATRKPNRTGP